MNEYGALVEWYWQGKTELLGEKHYTVSVVDEWVWSFGGMKLTRENWSTGRKTLYSVGGRWMSMEHWWNDTDRGNWSTRRKTLYSVGGRWMNEYGALVEWYWQEKPEVFGEKPLTESLRLSKIPDGLTSVSRFDSCLSQGTACKLVALQSRTAVTSLHRAPWMLYTRITPQTRVPLEKLLVTWKLRPISVSRNMISIILLLTIYKKMPVAAGVYLLPSNTGSELRS
jgi:hypothetical protein